MPDLLTDLLFQDEGTIVIIYQGSEEGRQWLAAHVDPDAMTWGEGIVAEPRYAFDIMEGALEAGLTCGPYNPQRKASA